MTPGTVPIPVGMRPVRRQRPSLRRRTYSILLACLLAGSVWALGSALWIDAKAVFAQILLDRAWATTLATYDNADDAGRYEPVKPWPWADVWPVGRLQFPDGETFVVLNGTSGQALAFGPGQVDAGFGDDGHIILAGHRDTHFAGLADVREDDVLTWQDRRGELRHYTVRSIRIVDSRKEMLQIDATAAELQLVSCYPFDDFSVGSPLRYVVTAELNEQTPGYRDLEPAEQHATAPYTHHRR